MTSGGKSLALSGVPEGVAARLVSLMRPPDSDDGLPVLVDRDIVADARDKASPLHGYFEWDDSVAAEAHRLAQAQSLIRRVRVTVIRGEDAPPVKVRAWVAAADVVAAASATKVEPGAYLAIESVAGRTEFEASMLDSMRRDLEQLKRKYTDTSALLAMVREVLAT